MSDIYRLKHNDLFIEFTRYITNHPKFSEQIPEGAEVILLDSRDAGYTRFMLKSVPSGRKNVVFVDVGELAPIRSRLKKPRIVSQDMAKKLSLSKSRN
ncbi:MAG: hypothetical protein DPW18_02110 [Chloroflexi bacterium]|nr:hypothetical protein [Chloroflexota bacterium]